MPFFAEKGFDIEKIDPTLLKNLLKLYKERIKILSELPDVCKFAFTDDIEYDEEGVKKYLSSPEIKTYLSKFSEVLKNIEEFTKENIETALRSFANEEKIEHKTIIHPLRIILTGKTVGPGLFELMEALGKEVCIRKINIGIHRLFQS